jgi:penicillin-binding protein 1B
VWPVLPEEPNLEVLPAEGPDQSPEQPAPEWKRRRAARLSKAPGEGGSERPPKRKKILLPGWWRRRPARIAGQVILGLAVLGCIVLIVAYFKLAREIDRRLAAGSLSSFTRIYAAPRVIAAGEALTPEQLVQHLHGSGYSSAPDNPVGRYVIQPRAVEIYPAAGTPDSGDAVKVEFVNNKVSRVVSINGGQAQKEYVLDSELIADVSDNREKRTPVRYAEIPPSLVLAVTSVEDKRFFKHSGLDFLRVLKAAYVDLRDGRKQQGASTLSMQLARSLWLDTDKRWKRKIAEVLMALHLEEKLTKNQIFESYANQVYLGRSGTFSINGFGEAARAFLGKDLSRIDTSEAALLAGLIQRPSFYNPIRYPGRARERRNLVLNLMLQNGAIDAREYDRAMATPLQIVATPVERSSAPYFLAFVQDELQDKVTEDVKPSQSVFTTLDAELQQAAEEAVREGIKNVDRQLQRKKRHSGQPEQPQVALVALDPGTGEIKALVGGRNYLNSQLNHATAFRQPGSVFKPFVYTAAIAATARDGSVQFTPATILNDDETTFYYDKKVYQPGNYHHNYMGEVTLRTALAHSLNVATVSLAEQVGYSKVVDIARRAGLNQRIKATPAVALGAYETTPIEIAGAYTIFANQGMRVTPTAISEVRAPDGTLLYRHTPNPSRVLDQRVAYVMVDLLQEVLRSGTGAGVRARGFTLPAGGKTGTSRDGWFAGFTTELVCVVWVGYDDNRELTLEGAKSALPIWAEFMKRAASYRRYAAAKQFQPPAGVSSVEVCVESGRRASSWCPDVRWERFLAGTEPAGECQMHSRLSLDPRFSYR